MAQGKIKFFNSMKGFGFIIQHDGSDIFLHKNQWKESGVFPEKGNW